MKRIISTCLVALFHILTSNAQPFTDIFVLNYTSHFKSDYHSPNLDFDDGVQLDIWKADLLLPIKFKEIGYLLAGWDWSRFKFSSIGNSKRVEFTRFDWHTARLGALVQWQNGRDQTLLLALPKWSRESVVFSSDAFQMGFVALHTRQISDALALKLGLFYNREFFGKFFMPLVGIDWKIKEDLWIYGTMPGNLQVHKILSPSIAISASYSSPSGSLMRDDNGEYVRIGGSLPPYSIFTADLHWNPFTIVVFKVSAGHSLWRSHVLYSENHKPITTRSFAEYSDGPIVKISLVFRVDNS